VPLAKDGSVPDTGYLVLSLGKDGGTWNRKEDMEERVQVVNLVGKLETVTEEQRMRVKVTRRDNWYDKEGVEAPEALVDMV
jgi:hypothetical protein